MANPSPDHRSPDNAGLVRCLLGASLLLGGLGVTFASIIGHGILFFYGTVVVGAILILQGFDRICFQGNPQGAGGLPDSVPALIYVWIAMAVTATAGVGYALATALRSVR